jgi:hypothetical protein
MPLGEPAIAGVPAAGSTVTCQLPPWAGSRPDAVVYQWYEDVGSGGAAAFVPIHGATNSALTVTTDLASHRLLCAVTATTTGGTVELTTAQ